MAFLQVPVLSDAPLFPARFKDDWEYAVAYRNLIGLHAGKPRELANIHARATTAILARAQALRRSLAEQVREKLDTWDRAPFGELDTDETMEGLDGRWPPAPENIWVSEQEIQPHYHLILFDSSISMQGERFAMQMLGLAMLASNLPSSQIGLVAFDSQPTVIKAFRKPMSSEEIVSRALQCVPQGSTDIAAALEKGEELKRKGSISRMFSILLTDGQQTSGKNPLSVAHRLAPLIVIPLNPHPETLTLCRSLARQGRGLVIPINHYRELPTALCRLSERLKRR